MMRMIKKIKPIQYAKERTLLVNMEKGLVQINAISVKALLPTKTIFLSMQQYLTWSTEIADCLPHDFDVVVGCPRTGMVVASIVALKHGTMLSTPEMMSHQLAWAPHESGRRLIATTKMTECNKVLLIDDTVASGRTFDKATELISLGFPDADIFKACVVTTKYDANKVDYCHKIIPESKRILNEWQLSSLNFENVASDMDGVLCKENSDAPLFIPKFKLKAVITDRLEPQRAETERWLKQHHVRYDHLIMAKTVDERGGLHKMKALWKLKPIFFYIESSPNASRDINNRTSIPVLCYSEKRMYG
jgi:adenine/guanine phosphoribosyltransferase-like PRPP-binding protein